MSERTASPELTAFSRPSDLENQVSRLFHVPPERLFHFWTDPSTFALTYTTDPTRATVETYEFRQGGKYSIVTRGGDGGVYRFQGEYLEIVPPRRIVNTWEVSMWPGVRAVETDEFERVGESTRLTIRWKYPSREDRDRMKGVGGKGGISEQWDFIADLLART
ncbi:MAG: SRPBCC domain-containing protein [Thermoplasmata archaeon]|nr:SRPBCC domain-containing protein [Thermoplasmata archaeon]